MVSILSTFSYKGEVGNILAQMTDSDTLDVTAVVPSLNPPGGASGSIANPSNSVTISGFTFPNAKVTLLKDGQVATTLIANADGTFRIVVNSLNLGSYQFSVFAEDRDGISSSPHVINAPVYTVGGYTYAGVILPPTIQTNTTTVGAGQSVVVSGYAAPGATVYIDVPGLFNLGNTVADQSGFYRFEVRDSLAPGLYMFRTRAQVGITMSFYSKPIQIVYYTGVTPPPNPEQMNVCVDYNKDNRVNLIDFSILLFWFNKANPPQSIDCNRDNVIDIKDFSLLMYFWTS